MISLPQDDRAGIDAAIGVSLARIGARSAGLGPAAEALGEAIARAANGGKRLRPALVVAAFRALGGEDDAALYPVAAAFELLHTAFVIHDDVIDRDTMRRGIPNVAGEFQGRARAQGADAVGATLLGDAAGILAGDLLLHEAWRVVASAPLPPEARTELLDLLDEAVLVSAAGELADVEYAVSADVPRAELVLAASRNKTAVYSFTAPLAAGALLAGALPAARASLTSAGDRIGIAFQLVDDLIGTFGTDAEAGRAAGADLRESKRTPLVALARDTPTWPRVSETMALAWTGPVAVREAQQALDASGARGRVHALVEETLAAAQQRAADGSLPPAAVELVDGLCASVARRLP
jgi:geranylgeranyl pyrophosphate synthase